MESKNFEKFPVKEFLKKKKFEKKKPLKHCKQRK